MKKAKTQVKNRAVKTVKRVKKTAPKAKKAAAAKRSPAVGLLAKRAPAEAFSKSELAGIRAKLSVMRGDIAKTVDDKKAFDMTEPEVGDSIDQAAQSLDKEILFELSDNERTMLDSIEAALRKIDNGTYGICEHCKKRIEKKRLKAVPPARYCLPCQTGSEKSRMQ